jgi:phosphoenolpyruvate synthase/pyruvate phosphate dikinase
MVVKDINLKQGTLVTIKGSKKLEYTFEVPKTSAKISESIGRKITLCFCENSVKLSPGVQALQNVGKTPSFGGINFGNILSSGTK